MGKQVAESSVEAGQVDEATRRSAIGLASLPSYLELMYGNRIPDQKVQQTMYTKLCDVALKAYSLQSSEKTNSEPTTNGRVAIGIGAELAVLLLHQRFTIQRLGDNSQMLALPSRLSEDHGVRRRNRKNPAANGWDISVMTMYPNDREPVLRYKVQVKSSAHAASYREGYAKDIISVNANEDLMIGKKERRLGRTLIRTIPIECNSELKGMADEWTTKRLDRRTDKLLEILG